MVDADYKSCLYYPTYPALITVLWLIKTYSLTFMAKVSTKERPKSAYKWSILEPFVWMSSKSLSAYVVMWPVPIVPVTDGKSTTPFMIIVVPPATSENPVITHLFTF